MSRNWIIAGVAAVCFITGVALSRVIEPGVRVEKVTLAVLEGFDPVLVNVAWPHQLDMHVRVNGPRA